jgi:predicted pyridoxine 5'-phosphate oxidase superfamily flavin-nucleotide-binding protein
MSINIPKELQDFIGGKIAWVATSDKDGLPNLAPKGTLMVVDDQTLAFANLFSLKTRAALEQNPRAAVAVIDPIQPAGYQFKGDAEIIESGPLFEEVKTKVSKMAPGLPAAKSIVKITVREIYSLTPGPDAGKKIA